MSHYRLFYGGTELGDEVIAPLGTWQKTTRPIRSDEPEPIAPLDNRPLALELYPRFRVRKKFADSWSFEEWLFDLIHWADGQKRRVYICTASWGLIADYGECKLVSLDRPTPLDSRAGRWSDQIILTFQSDTPPRFV